MEANRGKPKVPWSGRYQMGPLHRRRPFLTAPGLITDADQQIKKRTWTRVLHGGIVRVVTYSDRRSAAVEESEMLRQISKHGASLTEGEIVEESDLGSIRRLTADVFPILQGLSIKRLLINPGAMRTPHWHANANELTYCVSGTALVSVLDTGSRFASFVVRSGDMFHIDSGSLHHIENIGTDACEFIITFRSERPEDFGLGAAFGAMTDAVLGNTYDLPASDFAAMRRSTV